MAKKPYNGPTLTPLQKRVLSPCEFPTEIHLAWYPNSEFLRCYTRIQRGSGFIPVSLYVSGVNDLQMLNLIDEIALHFHLWPNMRFSDTIREIMRTHKGQFIIGNFDPDDLSKETHDDAE